MSVGTPVYLELEQLLLDKAEFLGFRTVLPIDLQRRSISISPAFYIKHGHQRERGMDDEMVMIIRIYMNQPFLRARTVCRLLSDLGSEGLAATIDIQNLP